MSVALLEVVNVSKTFQTGRRLLRRQTFKAVDGVNLEVRPGETLGIVGESGSGKSTLLRMMLRLIRPSEGSIHFGGRDIWTLSGSEVLGLRRQIQAVFQDPASSFNPRHCIGALLSAPLEVHGVGTRESRRNTVSETLALVGLNAAFLARHPHQLSGGQRQRVAIARAIILRPSLVLADEPTSALDVSVQAQILNLFKKTKRELGLTYVFVSHNLAVIRYVSDRVAVMRHGTVIEMGESAATFAHPQHPYTRALLEAVPDPDLDRRRRTMQPPGPAAERGIA
jgi:ABC-type glutathione transport system ATPase component